MAASKAAAKPVVPPKPPLLEEMELLVDLPDTPLFENQHLISVLDFPEYDVGTPWHFDASKLEQCSLISRVIPKLRLWDSVFVRCDLSANKLFEAGLLRSEFLGCRGTGLQLGESDVQDVRFSNCKLNMANFRKCKLTRVVFENCILDEVDFNAAKLTDVAFIKCELNKTDFSGAKLQAVDLTKCGIRGIRGVMSLKNARITEEQLFELAPLLAQEVGLVW